MCLIVVIGFRIGEKVKVVFTLSAGDACGATKRTGEIHCVWWFAQLIVNLNAALAAKDFTARRASLCLLEHVAQGVHPANHHPARSSVQHLATTCAFVFKGCAHTTIAHRDFPFALLRDIRAATDAHTSSE